MKIIGIIPARYASSRFPGKPLVDIGGKSMIQRVYEQVKGCSRLAEVVIATDDQRIEEHVRSFAGNVLMTSTAHESGTDRCAEVISKINGFDVAINIQGDEPFINPLQIELLCSLFDDPTTDIGTLIKQIDNEEDLFQENTPKVIIGNGQQALYFSRQTIPFLRGLPRHEWLSKHIFYKHIGVYGYRTEVLKAITKLPLSTLEKAEALEQLRWLENGYRIKVAETAFDTISVDRPEDLETIKRTFF
ncbi:3-deoxy-manno-octulosonate cytidylyltransferase [Sphingobacterium griseoflavum]|uniref:3-deoxy-manno-octulosonate cytidylyltransferase n=1 Tax=Sphingobacterium griseoflavum TaxID=1474952 RepID=A0ABQ3HSU3_9SPHI|nr:3-deoxy-manno-octulosonate cytidylyltransferase [Sphingobacterium griseoflavum]GHE23294.1 3-deoxy-manno-octulosonate cytidylyltransferase [Sphingobacterium griseoflavum]